MRRQEMTLKDKHRGMWALGDYPAVASTVIPDLGAVLVEAVGITAGDRVLDVAAGPGNAAIPAALIGADVVACDLTPELLASGRLHAEQRGADLEWREADAEALPFSDGEFDKVISCVGVMFARSRPSTSSPDCSRRSTSWSIPPRGARRCRRCAGR
jgi:2-polyprenyl-3-methyl-5-hydroxy-6-metoxy-1,4-benzoquinol methylase